jgi:hypothetical protein
LKYSTFSSFWSITIWNRDSSLQAVITLVVSKNFPIPQHLPISISLSTVPCSTVSFLVICKFHTAITITLRSNQMHYFYYLKLKNYLQYIALIHYKLSLVFLKFTRHVSAPASRHLQGCL